MKKAVITCVVSMLASSAFATLSKDEIKRLNDAGTILSELRNSRGERFAINDDIR